MRQRDRGQKSVLNLLKHTAEHGRIVPAHTFARTSQKSISSRRRIPRQFKEVHKECFEHLERPFAFATVCIAVDDEEWVVMVMDVFLAHDEDDDDDGVEGWPTTPWRAKPRKPAPPPPLRLLLPSWQCISARSASATRKGSSHGRRQPSFPAQSRSRFHSHVWMVPPEFTEFWSVEDAGDLCKRPCVQSGWGGAAARSCKSRWRCGKGTFNAAL